MAECLTVQDISDIAGGSSTSSNFPNVNECPNKTEAESNWKVTVTDDASTNELVTSAKKSMRRIYVDFYKEKNWLSFKLHLNTNVGGFDFANDEEHYYVDVPYSKDHLIVTDISGTIGNTDNEYSRLALLSVVGENVYDDQYADSCTVWTQKLQPLETVTLENHRIDHDYYMNPFYDQYQLFIYLH